MLNQLATLYYLVPVGRRVKKYTTMGYEYEHLYELDAVEPVRTRHIVLSINLIGVPTSIARYVVGLTAQSPIYEVLRM